ncbi:unnamed protein product [Caenorhabditis auriculariae]|uniref:Uncharacterized protein n=1 Tax=Caenorhabditis auriculariae TaxID=2777116 RepID=A0A8S1H1P2_9PELO|nr:unnamed protein product [Caenorhabditis auriculariae]
MARKSASKRLQAEKKAKAEETVELPPKDESQDLVDGLNTMSIQSDRAETRMKTSSSWNLKAAPFTPSSEKNTKDKSKEESPADENNAEFSSVSYWAPSDMAYRRRLWSPPPKKVSDDKKASKESLPAHGLNTTTDEPRGIDASLNRSMDSRVQSVHDLFNKKPSVAYERLRVSVVFQGKVLGPVNFTLNCIQKISGCKIRLNAAYLRPRTAFNFSLDRNPEFIEFECYKHGISYFIYPSGEIAPDFQNVAEFPVYDTNTEVVDAEDVPNFNGYPDFAANSDQNVVHNTNFNGYPDFAANSDQNVVNNTNFNGYPDFAANSDQNVVNNTNFNGYPDFAANSDQNVNVVNNTNFNGYPDFAANSDQNVVHNTNFNGYPDFAANSDQNVVNNSNFNGYPDFAANYDQNVNHTDVNGYPVYAAQNNFYDMNYNPVTPQNK